jgi:hypothetical protein
MSTKTTFKRIALVTVAALGFGVLSTVPSSAAVAGLKVTVTNGAATTMLADSTTAATIQLDWTATLGQKDSYTVQVAYRAQNPSGLTLTDPQILYSESATSVASRFPVVDSTAAGVAVDADLVFAKGAAVDFSDEFNIRSHPTTNTPGITHGVTFKLYLGETGTTKVAAGTYKFNVIATVVGADPIITPVDIVVTTPAAAAAPVPSAGNAKAFIQQGTSGDLFTGLTVLADSVTVGSLTAGTRAGQIQVSNFTSANAVASDTITVKMTGQGYLVAGATTGREFTVLNEDVLLIDVMADGSSGTGTITITTEKGASFVKTVTFYDQKPSKVVATVEKAFIKAGTTQVDDVFLVSVTDAAGSPITDAVVTAKATDTTTTVGGVATCDTTYDATDKGFYCHVKGLSTIKFGPVAYTITATGANAAKTVVTTSATVTFADNVATKAVLAGPASGAPGAALEYTITLTEKNGYPVADDVYGVGNANGGVLFATRVASGWTTAPFATTDSFTSVSGVITSKGTLPLAGTATGTWTLVGDGLQTLAANAIDKTIGKTTITATTEVVNAAADAATAAAEAAEAAAQDATDAALDATTAAEAAGALAQEAVDAVAELSAEVTKLMAGVKAQITYLTKLVMRLAAK